MTIQHHEGFLPGKEGLRLHYQGWQPDGPAKAVLAIVHGLGGHSGLFGNVVQQLVPHQYAVYAIDLRGHGRSDGLQGHVDHWSDFRADLEVLLQWVAEQEPNCPQFLLGHSLGGLVVLEYVLRQTEDVALAGVIAVAPALGQVGVSSVRLTIGQILSQVYPRFRLKTGIDLKTASRDPAVVERYAHDPLRHEFGSARLVIEFAKTLDWVHHHASEWHVPLLILHGGADQVTDPDGGKRFCQSITFPDKEWREYPEMYHELQNDIGYEQVLSDLEAWLDRHLPVQASTAVHFSDNS